MCNRRWIYALVVNLYVLAPGLAAADTTVTLVNAATKCVVVASINYDDDPAAGDICAVVAFKPISGTAPALFYQHQIFFTPDQAKTHPDIQASVNNPEGNDGAGMAVLELRPDGKMLELINGMSGQDAYFDPPPHVEMTRQGAVLLIPATAIVSSAPDLSVAMRQVDGKWVTIIDDWSAKIVFPSGLEQWRGGLMNWQTLVAEAPLWRAGDAQCCPSGGSYYAQLRLDGTHLVLKSVRFSKDGLPD